jgi:hypothetical protein
VPTPVGDAAALAPAERGRSTHWIVALLVAVPLLVAGSVGLPLFQDGSSYLLELMTSQSAVRHHRYSALLVQAPSIAALKLSALVDLEPRATLPVVRSLFSFSYAVLPFVALAWSWLLAKTRDPAMMLWPTVTILLLNVVNFSGVSEILLATQLALPLLLAASQRQPSRFSIATVLVLVPVILLLHALVAVLFAGLACGMALRARRLDGREASVAWVHAAVFSGAGFIRVLLDAGFATRYERDLWIGPALVDYFGTNFETSCLLVIATGSALWFAWRREVLERVIVVAGIGLTALMAWTALRNLAGLQASGEQPVALLALLGAVPIAMATLVLRGTGTQRASLADRVLLTLLWSAAGTIITRYAVLESFPLKTGATALIAAALLVFAASDSMRDRRPDDLRRREHFALHAGAVFAVLALSKAAIWDAATTRLARELSVRTAVCAEIDDPSMDWVRRSPGAILNNWALPTLGLVSATTLPPVLLLEAGDCARFARSGEIVVDPWTVLTPRQLPFVFGDAKDAHSD